MHEKIMIVDDEKVIVTMIEEILNVHNFKPVGFTSPKEALKSLQKDDYDLILSDFFMPDMDGQSFLREVRQFDLNIPFLVITTNTDVKKAIKMIKDGANDYISKPFKMDELIFHIDKALTERKNLDALNRIEKEKKIIEFEKKQLVDWKILYATKDAKQSDMIIEFINRTLNQSGGFVWLDILKNNITRINEHKYEIDQSLVELIIKTTEENKKFFDNFSYISKIDMISINSVNLDFMTFYSEIKTFSAENLSDIVAKYNKKLVVEQIDHQSDYTINIDTGYFKKVLTELVLNAIKYSPDNTTIEILFEKNSNLGDDYIDIAVKNVPRATGIKDISGSQIIGIPYEYSELVFDMFYTINAYPRVMDEEEWSNGTGLYISRKIVQKLGGWISNANGVDYSKKPPVGYIKFKITLPLKKIINNNV